MKTHERMQRAEERIVEHIVGVAVLWMGRVYELPWPCRHCHVISMLGQCYPPTHIATHRNFDENQGFVTNTRRYVDRQEAMVIARAADQLIAEPRYDDTLFSEDVW